MVVSPFLKFYDSEIVILAPKVGALIGRSMYFIIMFCL